MKATWLYRIAAVLLVLFALGHTIGFLSFKAPTPEGVAVHIAMNNVHFQVTAYLLFAAFVAWHLSGLAGKTPQLIGTLGWGLFAVQVASLALSWIYFAGPPIAFSGVLAVCLGWAAWIVQGARG